MAKYLLSVHHDFDGPAPSDEEMQLAFKQVDELNDELMSTGAWVFAGGLQHPNEAKVVHGTDAMTVDGPFVESKEHLGGFWVIDAEDLDVALSWAGKATIACDNPVQVEPMADFGTVPPTSEGRPQFLLSVHAGGDTTPRPEMTPEQMQAMGAQMQSLEADLQSTGTWLYSARLAGPDTATVARADAGVVVLTDGPFAESKEHIAGFYVIGAESNAKAQSWAERVADCVGRPIELRPFQVESED